MQNPEEYLVNILRDAGVDFTASLPCEKIKILLEMVGRQFFHVPLTREEEGVGICAGASLAGKRPAIFVQSSGIGNMINALLSLTQFYELPLAIFISQRGIYKEKIAAQLPMGRRLPGILRGAGIPFSSISSAADLDRVGPRLKKLYRTDNIHAFLLSPEIWIGSDACGAAAFDQRPVSCRAGGWKEQELSEPAYTRHELIEAIAPQLEGRVVVSNLGWPSKELYALKHQDSNFYMLGSMGMASPIGLGVALSSNKDVVVIDGDGSLLMNPGVLATSAHFSPDNLTIIAIDNSSYGSTGSQKTLTGSCVDLELVARGFGISSTLKTASKELLSMTVKERSKGLRFIHALAIPGNSDVPNIPLDRLQIRDMVRTFLAK